VADYGLENPGEFNESASEPRGGERRRTSVRDFLAVIFRRRGIIISVFVMAVVVVLILNASTPTTYESYASILVSRGQPQSVFATGVKILSWEEELNSELEVVKSQQIHQLAQRQLNERDERGSDNSPLRIDPVKIRVTTPGKSSVVNIAYRATDPKAPRAVIAALTRSYINFRHETRAGPEVETFFEEQIEALEERLTEWEQRKADYMAEERVTSPNDERFFLLQERKETQTQLSGIQNSIAERQAQIEVLRRMQLERKDEPGLQIYPFSGPLTREEASLDIIVKELMLKRSEYYDASAKYTENHPEVQARRRHVQDLEAALDREFASYIRHLEARLEVLLAQEGSLTQLVRALSAELAELPTKEMKLGQIDRVISALRTQYDALVRSSIDARIKRTGSADWNVILLSPASAARAIRVHDYVRLAVLPLFSLILGIGMAFLMDGLDHSIKDAGDVEAYLGLPVLTSVSPFGGR
jgi:uncharacterized protein involved in exopolysaccharide biosynthesis